MAVCRDELFWGRADIIFSRRVRRVGDAVSPLYKPFPRPVVVA